MMKIEPGLSGRKKQTCVHTTEVHVNISSQKLMLINTIEFNKYIILSRY